LTLKALCPGASVVNMRHEGPGVFEFSGAFEAFKCEVAECPDSLALIAAQRTDKLVQDFLEGFWIRVMPGRRRRRISDPTPRTWRCAVQQEAGSYPRIGWMESGAGVAREELCDEETNAVPPSLFGRERSTG
jgi:hypothetical protein